LLASSAYDSTFGAKETPFTCFKSHAVYAHDAQDHEFYDAQELDTALELTYDIDDTPSTCSPTAIFPQNQVQVCLDCQLHG